MIDLFTWAEMSRFKWWLYLLGPILESFGIVVILFPDVLPWLLRWWSWVQRHTHTLVNVARRVLRIPRDMRLAGGTASAVATTARGRIVIAPGEKASADEKVKFLMEKYLETDAAIDVLRERGERFEQEVGKRFEQSRREVEAWTKEAIRTEIARYGVGRIVGSVLLFVGLLCSAFANVID